jgi:multiple sugar transport system permease protein
MITSRSPSLRLAGLAFVGPFVAFYTVLLIVPLIMGMFLSVHQADLFGARRWIGIDNYVRLAGDPVFHSALLNTLLLTLLVVPVLTALTLALALALNRATRGAAVFRGIFFSSSVLSVTIVTLIWRFVLTPDAGLIAKVLGWFGAEPIPFLSHPDLTIPALAITTIWWSIGLPMMLFLAGLQQVPGELYEAAALDKAGRWTTLRRVTLPSIRRTTIVVVMLQTAAQLQIFGQAQLLTSGGPSGASRPVVLWIYEVAFGRWELGYATAAAEILFLLVLGVTALQYWATTREDRAR